MTARVVSPPNAGRIRGPRGDDGGPETADPDAARGSERVTDERAGATACSSGSCEQLTPALASGLARLHPSDDAAMTPRSTMRGTRNEPEEWFVIELHTFGDAMIRVGEKDIRPSAPVLFAALLYLCVERGRRVPRAALQELLFPEKDERSGAHSLRQLLYKLRQLGVPLETDASSVSLLKKSVRQDHQEVEPFLPGYRPSFSDRFSRWLEEVRFRVSAAARNRLLSSVVLARSAGDYTHAAEHATALLKIDPLNEEGTLALAEALVLSGQKVEALRLLDEYTREVGIVSEKLVLPAAIVRRRISERFTDSRPLTPLHGRSLELAELLSHFSRAQRDQATMTIIWGDAGIGKSRLASEYRSHLSLRSAVTALSHCQPHDPARPLGAIVDLVPELLQARGALAVSPNSMSALRRLLGESENDSDESADAVAARIRVALRDLISCVSSEVPVVLIIEDGHWLDVVSRAFLHSLVGEKARVHIVITQRGRPTHSSGETFPAGVFTRKLDPLEPESSRSLLDSILGDASTISAELIRQCIDLASGNPLFVCTIGEHLRQGGAAPPIASTLSDLLRQRLRLLSAHALLLLRFVAAIGAHGTPDRLARCMSWKDSDTLLALQELTDRGLVIGQCDTIKCSHDLVAELVLSELPSALSLPVMAQVADVLETDGIASRRASLLWSCAECWDKAGNRERARLALQQCAQLSAEIGQPVFAIRALATAQTFATGTDSLALAEEAVRIADESSIDAAIAEHANRYRNTMKMLGRGGDTSSIIRLAEINTMRRDGASIWRCRDVLWQCAFDESAPLFDRLRAARVFLLAAEEELEAGGVAPLFHAFIRIGAPLANTPPWHHFLLTYHMTFGDKANGIASARTILKGRTANRNSVGCHLLGHAAFVLFRGGYCDEALSLFRDAWSESRELHGDAPVVQQMGAQISMIARQSGQMDVAEEFHQACAIYFANSRQTPCAAHVANEVERALAGRDLEKARRSCDRLYADYAECFTPNRERVTVGHRIAIDLLSHKPVEKELILKANDLYHKGRSFYECDMLAFAIAFELASQRQIAEATSHLDSYLTQWRRELYPPPPFLLEVADELGCPVPNRRTASVIARASNSTKPVSIS